MDLGGSGFRDSRLQRFLVSWGIDTPVVSVFERLRARGIVRRH